MISPHAYILSSLGWKTVKELKPLEYISNPSGDMRKVISRAEPARNVNCLDVVLLDETGLSRSIITLSESTVVVLEKGIRKRVHELQKGDRIYKSPMSKINWYIDKIVPKIAEVCHIESDKHFFVVNGCYLVIGDDTV